MVKYQRNFEDNVKVIIQASNDNRVDIIDPVQDITWNMRNIEREDPTKINIVNPIIR